MSNLQTIAATLAQQDAQKQAPTQTGGGNLENVAATLAANNGQVTAPTSGPTIGPAPKTSDVPMFGYQWMTPEQRMTTPLAKLVIAAQDKLRDVENFNSNTEGAKQHPIQAKFGDIANSIEGFLWGNEAHPEFGIGTGKYGMLTNPVTAALIPGPEGVPAAASAIEGGVNLARNAVSGVREAVSGSSVPRVAKQVFQGKELAQAPAQAALRTGAEASAADAGVTASTDAGAGIRTLMQKPIAAAADAESALYDTVNDAAQTDMKSLYDYRSELQDALDDPTNIGNRKSLMDELQENEQSIADGEANVQAQLGKDAPKLIQQAKAATQQRYAMQDLEQKLFNNESVVSGDVAHGAPESINVDAAIRQVQQLDKPSRFAPRGTPTRLVQALGQDGATALKQGLYDAQKTGQSALTVQRVAKFLAIGAGVSGGGAALVHSLFGR